MPTSEKPWSEMRPLVLTALHAEIEQKQAYVKKLKSHCCTHSNEKSAELCDHAQNEQDAQNSICLSQQVNERIKHLTGMIDAIEANRFVGYCLICGIEQSEFRCMSGFMSCIDCKKARELRQSQHASPNMMRYATA